MTPIRLIREVGEPPFTPIGCFPLVDDQGPFLGLGVTHFTAGVPLRLRALDLLTGRELGTTGLVAGKRTASNRKSAARILMN